MNKPHGFRHDRIGEEKLAGVPEELGGASGEVGRVTGEVTDYRRRCRQRRSPPSLTSDPTGSREHLFPRGALLVDWDRHAAGQLQEVRAAGEHRPLSFDAEHHGVGQFQ